MGFPVHYTRTMLSCRSLRELWAKTHARTPTHRPVDRIYVVEGRQNVIFGAKRAHKCIPMSYSLKIDTSRENLQQTMTNANLIHLRHF